VEYLLGSTARLGDVIVLGLLAQLKEVCVTAILLFDSEKNHLVVTQFCNTQFLLYSMFNCLLIWYCRHLMISAGMFATI